MAVVGTTFISHILPVIFGFFGILLIAGGIMDNKKYKLVIGILLFVIACIFPFVILSMIL